MSIGSTVSFESSRLLHMDAQPLDAQIQRGIGFSIVPENPEDIKAVLERLQDEFLVARTDTTREYGSVLAYCLKASDNGAEATYLERALVRAACSLEGISAEMLGHPSTTELWVGQDDTRRYKIQRHFGHLVLNDMDTIEPNALIYGFHSLNSRPTDPAAPA